MGIYNKILIGILHIHRLLKGSGFVHKNINMTESLSGDVIQMPCLGRHFTMGMLYDCRKDSTIPGMTLWNDATIRDALHSEEQIAEGYEIIAEDTLESKAMNLDISANLKLSFLGGLIDVQGSAKYLCDRTSSMEQSRISLKYWSTSRFDQLTMTQLGHIEFPRVFSETKATHVVVGIQYGADAFFVFKQNVQKGQNKHEVSGSMQVMLKKTFDGLLDVGGGGEVKISSEDREKANKFECKFHGDVHLKSNPTTFESAMKVYQELPSLIRGDDTPKVVPKKVWLYPLINLNSKAAKIVAEINTSLVNQAQEVMEEMLLLENQANDLLNASVTSYISGLQQLLNTFKEQINAYRVNFSQKLNQLLPMIREGGEKESAIADLLQVKHASPFASNQLSTWMRTKQQEIKVLDGYFQAMRKIKSIEMAFSPGALDALTYDFSIDRILCFSFKGMISSDVFVQRMKEFLRNGKSSCEDEASSSWLKDKKLMSSLRQQVRQFTEFAAANIGSQATKFAVTDGGKEAHGEGAEILLYKNGMPEPFSPPLKPDDVSASDDGIKHNSVNLVWSGPKFGSESVQHYIVSCQEKEENGKGWKKVQTQGRALSCTVDQLQPLTAYRFKVQAKCDAGVSEESEVVIISTVSSPFERLAIEMLKKSTKVDKPAKTSSAGKTTNDTNMKESQQPTVYKLPQKVTHRVPGQMICTAEIGEPPSKTEIVKHKVLMVVGATGAGKSTLINGMVNYILKVKWKDDFRFKLIVDNPTTQTKSVTREITAYTFHRMEGSSLPYTITIIDTPGFGDTDGIKRDKKITDQVKNFFSLTQQYGIDHLDGIGFVTQSALVRLTATQQYIFDSILAVFGKNVANNIFIMVTFCDGQKPPVINAVDEAEIPYSQYFKFNNSALDANNSNTDDDNFDEMFWKMGMNSFKKFFEKFEHAESVSLTLTQQVLETREKLETAVQGLQRQMNACLAEMEVLHQEELEIQKHEKELETNKHFKYKIKVPYYEAIPLEDGQYVTNCLRCNFTCHFPCYIPDNDDKWKCNAMDSTIGNGQSACCTVCSGNCSWKVHKNTREKFELRYRTKEKTSEDLLQKFNVAASGKSRVQKMIKSHAHKLREEHAKLHALIEEARQCLEILNEIALKPNPLTQVDYIQLLIESEQRQAKDGWHDRVNYLEKTKDQAALLTIVEDDNDIDKRIEEERKQQGPGWEEKIEKLENIKRIKHKAEEYKSSSMGALTKFTSVFSATVSAGVHSVKKMLGLASSASASVSSNGLED